MLFFSLTVALIHSVCLSYIGFTQLSVWFCLILQVWVFCENCILSSVNRKRVEWVMHDRIKVVRFSIIIDLFIHNIEIVFKTYIEKNYR